MSVPLMIVATAMSAFGALSNAKSQSNAATYNAQVAQRDQQIGLDQGNAQAAIQARSARMQIDAGRAQYGASGVDVNSGSPLDVLQSSAMNASLDNQTIKYNSQIKGYGYGNEATSYNYQANASKNRGYWSAGSDLLSGGGKAYGASYTPNGAGTAINTNSSSM